MTTQSRDELLQQVGPARNGIWYIIYVRGPGIGSPGLLLIHEIHQATVNAVARRANLLTEFISDFRELQIDIALNDCSWKVRQLVKTNRNNQMENSKQRGCHPSVHLPSRSPNQAPTIGKEASALAKTT
jgi:hypothetical protein